MDGRNVLGRKICNGDGADSFGQKAVSFQRKKRYVDQCNDANGGANFYEYGGRRCCIRFRRNNICLELRKECL